MRWAIVAVVVVVAATFALVIRPPIKEPGLAHDLIAMQRDVDFRAVSFRATGNQRLSFSDLPVAIRERYEDQVVRDQRHQDQLGALLDRYGWPTEKMVGREGVRAAMLVVQRGPDIDFKERAVSLMHQAGADDNADYATLVDMIAVRKGLPQTYGTAWTCAGDGTVRFMTPLKDPQHFTQLRASVGLPPYDKFSREFCRVPDGGIRIVGRDGGN